MNSYVGMTMVKKEQKQDDYLNHRYSMFKSTKHTSHIYQPT